MTVDEEPDYHERYGCLIIPAIIALIALLAGFCGGCNVPYPP